MSKNMSMALLFDFYGSLLTERQAVCVDLYYNSDLSLSEIADNLKITRQGARDNIKRGEAVLTDTESRLRLVSRFSVIKDRLSEVDLLIGEIERSPKARLLPDDIRLKINRILAVLGEVSEIGL